jgi:hypothetical protein
VEIRIEEKTGEFTTTSHELVSSLTRVSISGHGYYKGQKRNGDWSFGGQCVDELEKIRTTESLTMREIVRLIDIWNEWHLNDMQPGCEHQPAEFDAVCPHSGYKYGTRWLVKVVPDDVLAELRNIGDKLDGAS